MTRRREFLKQTAAAALLQPVTGAARAAGINSLPRRAGIAQTVLGPLDASRLGFTLAHEHVADGPYVLDRWPKAWGGRAEFVARALALLKDVKAAGIGTVVDLTTYDVGRDIRFLEEVCRGSALNMIAATGQRFFPPKLLHVTMPSRSVEGLAAFFIKEIVQGIDGTGIRAGVIKIGIVAQHPTALEEAGLRAGARASKATGIPVRIHTHAADRAGEGIAVILEDEGMDPARVSFDHSDDSGQMDYFLGLVRRGYSLGMDHVHRGVGTEFKPSFERRADCIKQLADAGFADNIFLSQDAEFAGALLPVEKREWRETIDPPDGMLFVMRRLIPHLTRIGISHRDIQAMTVDNPRRFFSLA
jgi:phosphotriesterase-related protein